MLLYGQPGWYLPEGEKGGGMYWSLNFEVFAYVVLMCYGHSILFPSLTLPTYTTLHGLDCFNN